MTSQLELDSNIGCWQFDPESRLLHWCSNTNRLLDINTQLAPEMISSLNFIKDEADLLALSRFLYNVNSSEQRYTADMDVYTSRGEVCRLKAKAWKSYDDDALVGVFGTFERV